MLYAADQVPRTDVLFYDDREQDGITLEFRLIYKGPLRSAQSGHSVEEKHRLRQHFHKQLADLWIRDPMLNRQVTGRFIPSGMAHAREIAAFPITNQIPDYLLVDSQDPRGRSFIEIMAEDYTKGGFRFVPLIRRKNGFTCALDVLFLRQGHPGDLIVSGDVDNRIKTLLDGLRMPRECSEIPNVSGNKRMVPDTNENPFYCLLEDDSLITGLQITTDRLLQDPAQSSNKDDVELVIHVTVIDPNALLGTNALP